MQKKIIFIIATILSLGCFTTIYAGEPVAKYSFDSSYDDATPVTREAYHRDEAIVNSDGSSFEYLTGMVNDCIYLNGSEGLRLNVPISNTETYSVSYWINPDRITACTPTVMITPNGFQAEKFINVTLEVDGLTPNIWTHMIEPYDERTSTGIWGGLNPGEWTFVTFVVDGSDPFYQNEHVVPVSLYLNGTLVSIGTVPKELCIDSTGFWFGINIWDDLYSGYLDELYFYDYSLSPDEVNDLFVSLNGNENSVEMPTVIVVEPEYPDNNEHGGWHNNGGSVSDDYIEIEQGHVIGGSDHLNTLNITPLSKQGIEKYTNTYSDIAMIIATILLILSFGLVLHYKKLKRNRY